MTDRNNAPAGRLVPTGEKPTETGRPMLQIAEEQEESQTPLKGHPQGQRSGTRGSCPRT